MQTPLVSVLMTAYNRSKYIAEAIESVLASEYENFELLIVDDGSIDDTMDIASSYADKDRRIKVYCNKKNLGDYPNRNKAASYAKGEFLFYVDSDDTICKDSISYNVQQMHRFPSADMLMIYLRENLKQPQLVQAPNSIREHFFKQQYLDIGPGGTFMRRAFFEKAGGYPVAYGPANDMFFNLKAAYFGKILLVPYVFVNYRIHEGQERNNQYSYIINNYRYLRDAFQTFDFPLNEVQKSYILKKNKRRFVVNLAHYLYRTGNLKKVVEAPKKAQFGMKDFVEGIFH